MQNLLIKNEITAKKIKENFIGLEFVENFPLLLNYFKENKDKYDVMILYTCHKRRHKREHKREHQRRHKREHKWRHKREHERQHKRERKREHKRRHKREHKREHRP